MYSLAFIMYLRRLVFKLNKITGPRGHFTISTVGQNLKLLRF